MSLVDLLKPRRTSPEDIIQRMTAEVAEAKASLQTASEVWGNALADQDAGIGEAHAEAVAQRALDAAQKTYQAKQAALAAVQGRRRAALVDAEVATAAAQWAKAVGLAEERQAAVVELQRLAEDFVGGILALRVINANLATTLPACPDATGALLNDGDVQGLVARELERLGYAGKARQNVQWRTPKLTDLFQGTTSLIRQWRDHNLAGR